MSLLQNTKDGGKDRKTKQKPKGKKEHPVPEKMNSTQKRKGNAPKSDGLGGKIPGKAGSFDFEKHLGRFKSIHTRKLELDQRMAAAKLPVWNHLTRVPVTETTFLGGGKAVSDKKRFQLYSEWKSQPQAESNLTKALKCSHNWIARLGVPPEYRMKDCSKCGIHKEDVKDEKDGYLLLSETQSDDLKMLYDVACEEIDELRSMFRDGMGNKPFMLHLIVDSGTGSATGISPGPYYSAANTALATVSRIRPSDAATQFAFMQGLFDEYKCERAHFDFFLNRDGGSPQTNNLTTCSAAACAYDPMNSGPYASVANILDASQKIGPIQMNLAGTTPQQMNKTGFYRFEVKMPGAGPQADNGAAASTISTGTWQDTATTAADYGFFKWYIPALGTSVRSSISGFLDMTCLFRCRT